MKHKVGDFVNIKGRLTARVKENYRVDIQDNYIWVNGDCIQGVFKTYEDGLADAWELARKVNAMSEDEFDKCFNFDWQCTTDFTYQEILAMVEAYEESKAIKVGDVVKVKTGAGSEHLGVVTQITANQNCACIVYADGSTEMNTANNMTKTNKHLDIEHLLEQIRGDE